MSSSLCQCIAQTSLAHSAQPSILYLQVTPFTCITHIPSLYKALYCTLLYTHQYTDYSIFLSHFILLTWYQSHSSDFLVPVDISGVLPLPSPSSSSHCQNQVTAVTPTVPTSLGYHYSTHPTAKSKAQSDRTANLEQNSTKNSQKLHHTHSYTPPEVSASRARAPRASTRCQYLSRASQARPRFPMSPTRLLYFTYCHVGPKVTSHCHVNTRQPLTVDFDHSQKFSTGPVLLSFLRRFRF